MIVLWRITTKCSFGCGFCAYDRSLRIPRTNVDAREVDRFGALLGQWARMRDEPVLLSWLGGEPFLWPPVIELSAKLHREYGLSISATTNGSTLLREQVQRTVLNHFAELTFSVDGLALRHDALRKAPGSWDRIAEGVRVLADNRKALNSGLRLRANIVLMRGSVADLPELLRTLADWGIDEITFNQLGGRDRPEFYPAHRLLPAEAFELRAMLPALSKELASLGTRLCANGGYLDRILASSRNEHLPVEDCEPGQRFLFIDENGQVSPCSFTTASYGLPINQITSVADLANLPLRFRKAREARRSPECADCLSTQTFGKFAA
jgi:radical SAM protein with 4Fe4S-binding SPASM domain